MKTILELKQELGQLYDQARAIVEKADTEKRAISTEEETQYNDIVTRMDALKVDIERREKLEGFTGVSKPQGSQYHPTKKTKDDANSLFIRTIRQPAGVADAGLQAEYAQAAYEERASNDTTLNITTAADGGDLVPVGHYNGIIERARPVALYNRLGLMQIPGSGTTVNVPVDAEADSGIFVSTNESGAFDRDAPAFSKVAMTLVKYSKKVDLTYELMQDEQSALMNFLNSFVAAGFAATMNSLVVAEALTGTAGLTADSATAIGAAEVPELLYKLSAEYAESPNVHWLLNRTTEGYLRGLRDTSLWTFAPDISNTANGRGVDSLLFGVPAHSTSYVPAIGAGNKSLVVGDFSKMAYRLDPNMTFLRDPYSRATYGEVILHYYFRVDVELLQDAAIQYMTHPTA